MVNESPPGARPAGGLMEESPPICSIYFGYNHSCLAVKDELHH